jgi:DNA-binding MarR family transcriptional regulator
MAPRWPNPRDLESELERQSLQAFRTIFSSARLHDAELRKVAGISASQTTASNIALTERRLVQRKRDPADQRVARLALTAAGRFALERAPGPGLLMDGLHRLQASRLTRPRSELQALLAVMQRDATRGRRAAPRRVSAPRGFGPASVTECPNVNIRRGPETGSIALMPMDFYIATHVFDQ